MARDKDDQNIYAEIGKEFISQYVGSYWANVVYKSV